MKLKCNKPLLTIRNPVATIPVASIQQNREERSSIDISQFENSTAKETEKRNLKRPSRIRLNPSKKRQQGL
jgi:hypothetical protein